jgi:hypothetical protein
MVPRITYGPAEAVSGARPPLGAPGGASSAERTGLRGDEAAGLATTPVLVPGLPAPFAAGPAAALPPEDSVLSGPAGSALMMLTGGIEAAEGKKMSLRRGRPVEAGTPVGFGAAANEAPTGSSAGVRTAATEAEPPLGQPGA